VATFPNPLLPETNAWCDVQRPGLDKSCIRKAINCHHLYQIFGALSISPHDGYTCEGLSTIMAVMVITTTVCYKKNNVTFPRFFLKQSFMLQVSTKNSE
jgi:hypothetical protein